MVIASVARARSVRSCAQGPALRDRDWADLNGWIDGATMTWQIPGALSLSASGSRGSQAVHPEASAPSRRGLGALRRGWSEGWLVAELPTAFGLPLPPLATVAGA